MTGRTHRATFSAGISASGDTTVLEDTGMIFVSIGTETSLEGQ